LLRSPLREMLTPLRPRYSHLAASPSTSGLRHHAGPTTRPNLGTWLSAAEAAGRLNRRSSAVGICCDHATVTAALSRHYSSGNVNLLKASKRQMNGRTKLDLLRKRVVLARHGETGTQARDCGTRSRARKFAS
jgi:transposase